MQRPFFNQKPIGIGRISAIFEQMMKGPKTATGMIKNAIKHHMDLPFMRLIKQQSQGDIAT